MFCSIECILNAINERMAFKIAQKETNVYLIKQYSIILILLAPPRTKISIYKWTKILMIIFLGNNEWEYATENNTKISVVNANVYNNKNTGVFNTENKLLMELWKRSDIFGHAVVNSG